MGQKFTEENRQEHRQQMKYTPFKLLSIIILIKFTKHTKLVYPGLELLLIKIIDWSKVNAKLPENSKFCEKCK